MSYASIEEAMLVGWGIERAFVCHVHDDHTASASINSVTGLWFCYTCHASGRVDPDRMEIDPRAVLRTVERTAKLIGRRQQVYPESWLDQYDVLGPGGYWLSRFSERACRAFRLGQARDGSYATIPFRTASGAVLGVIRRDLTGKDPAKYRYPQVEMRQYLFNQHAAEGRTLVLTEGATDVIAAWEADWPAAMATYGNRISREQVRQIHRYNPKRVVVAYDQDRAGREGWEKVRHALEGYFQIERLWWDDRYKDLASIPLSDRAAMLDSLRNKKVRIRAGQSGSD